MPAIVADGAKSVLKLNDCQYRRRFADRRRGVKVWDGPQEYTLINVKMYKPRARDKCV